MLTNMYNLNFRLVSFTFLKFIQSFVEALNKNQLCSTIAFDTIVLAKMFKNLINYLSLFLVFHIKLLRKKCKFYYLLAFRKKRKFILFYFYFYFYLQVFWDFVIGSDIEITKTDIPFFFSLFLRKLLFFFISHFQLQKNFLFFFSSKKERLHRISLLRSPFVHKKSFEHFGNNTYICSFKNPIKSKLNFFNAQLRNVFKLQVIPFGFYYIKKTKIRYFYF